jgi:nitric oxide dioxygenase
VKTPIHFVQAARNSRVHAFSDEVRALQDTRDNVQTHVFYDQPLDDDLAQRKCDSVGIVDVEWLRNATPHSNADFYICGPGPFMRNVYSALRELGVDDARMSFEFFGPRQSLAPSTSP